MSQFERPLIRERRHAAASEAGQVNRIHRTAKTLSALLMEARVAPELVIDELGITPTGTRDFKPSRIGWQLALRRHEPVGSWLHPVEPSEVASGDLLLLSTAFKVIRCYARFPLEDREVDLADGRQIRVGVAEVGLGHDVSGSGRPLTARELDPFLDPQKASQSVDAGLASLALQHGIDVAAMEASMAS